MTDLELLSRRLTKLEQRFRLMKRAALVVGILISAAALMAQVRGIPLPGEVLPSSRSRVEAQSSPTAPVEAEVLEQKGVGRGQRLHARSPAGRGRGARQGKAAPAG